MTSRRFLQISFCDLFAILLVVSFFLLRIDDIGNTPKGFFCDEASIAVNARSIRESGRDEHGISYPIFFKAFGEYKPALYIYIGSLIQPFFSDIHFVTRLPSTIFLALAMFVSYLLLKYMVHAGCGLIAIFLMGTDPWLHHFSHVSFTLTAVPAILVSAIFCFLKGLEKNQPWKIVSVLLFLLAVYTYPPARMFVPLFLCSLAVIYRKELRENTSTTASLGLHLVLFVALCLPLIRYMLYADDFLSRVEYLNVFVTPFLEHSWAHRVALSTFNYIPFFPKPDPNSWLIRLLMMILHYLSYFSPNYLFFHGDSNPRFGTSAFGVLGWLTAVGFVIGLWSMLRRKSKSDCLFLIWLLLHALPASLTWENIPHGGRGILGHPAFDCIAAIGLWKLVRYASSQYSREGQKKYALLIAPLLLLYSIHAKLFFRHYSTDYSVKASAWMQYGFRDMMEYIKAHHGDYEETVIVSTLLLYQPYIFALLYSDQPAEQWQESKKLPWNIKIHTQKLSPEQWRENILYIFSPTPTDLPNQFQLLRKFTWEDGVGESFSVYKYVTE